MKTRTVFSSLFEMRQRRGKKWLRFLSLGLISGIICFCILSLHFLSIPASAASGDYFAISDGTSCTLSFTGHFLTCSTGCCFNVGVGTLCGDGGVVEAMEAWYMWDYCDNAIDGPAVSGNGSATCILSDAFPTLVYVSDSYGTIQVDIPPRVELCGSPQNQPVHDNGKATPTPSCGDGSPVWSVNPINFNHYVTDTPLWYKPPYGPPVDIQLSYNSLTALSAPVPDSPFGGKWQLNYASYVRENADSSVTVVMPDGREDTYASNGSGGYNKPFGIFSTLTKTASQQYSVTLLDGTVYAYSAPASMSRIVLTTIIDLYNRSLAIDYDSSGKIVDISDALNRHTTFSYYASTNLVQTVTDPFGRSASFQYDATGNLTAATDMGGFTTIYAYDPTKGYLSTIKSPKITNPQSDSDYRIWSFLIEPNDGTSSSAAYPAPSSTGNYMGFKYRITITNPNNPDGTKNQEEYFYYGENMWYVSPRDYVSYVDATINNYTKAQKTLYFYDRSMPKGRLARTTTAAGVQTKYTYDSATGLPATITDGNSHIRTYSYNSNGLTTSYWDAKTSSSGTPTISIAYDPSNNIDATSATNGFGTIHYTYNNAHDVTQITDRMNYVTALTYNNYGQPATVTEAQGTPVQRETTFTYDPSAYTLSNISIAGNVVKSFTYDNIGRTATETYTDGVNIGYAYEKLDQIKTITYPDSRTEQIVNNTSCPYLVDSITDRANRTTSFTYDALKRLTQKSGPEGTFLYGYDFNSNLTTFTDADNKVTTFGYDLDNRLAKKTYADGKYVSYAYDLAGLLQTFTNARSQTINYSRDANNNLTSIAYSDGNTPNVTMTYDAYNRIQTRTDGIGIFTYTFDNDNRLTDVAYPWDGTNSSVHYGYNALNQLITLIPYGGQTINYGFDGIGRLTTIQRGTDIPYTYAYETTSSPLVHQLTRPNGSYTTYGYDPLLKRLASINNMTSTGQIINGYAYTYNAANNPDLRDTETITNGTPIDTFVAGTNTYSNNNLNQLTGITNLNRTCLYDNDGNTTQAYTPDGYPITMGYDAENRMITAQFTDSQSKVHLTNNYYTGDGLLAETKKTMGGTLVSDTRYVRAGFLPIQERDGSNNVTREYLWGLNYGGGIGGLLNLRQGGQDYNYLYDGKGNVAALIDINQNPVATYAYDSFGVLMKKTGTLDQPYMFSTKPYDAELGIVKYDIRPYMPAIGKWINRDPLGEAGDVNLYRAMGNNTVNFVDPWGLIITVEEVGNIVFNETRSLSGDNIDKVRQNVAHAIFNADDLWGDKRSKYARSAPSKVKKLHTNEQNTYGECQSAAQAADENRKKDSDPTDGAVFFNFRKNNWRGDFNGASISTQGGPLNNSFPTKQLPANNVYGNTYKTGE